MDHEITVAFLRKLLTDVRLKDNDVLVPNAVANLKVERDGRYLGFIDLLKGNQHVDLLEDA